MESWRKGELEGWGRQRAGRGWPISRCVGVCVCEGLEGPQSWWGENRIVLRAWHGAFDCATSERTVQGLDGTPAGFESQLDSATEEQHAGPCPFPGDVKDQGGLCVRMCVCVWGGGRESWEGRGRNVSELETMQRREGAVGSQDRGVSERTGTQRNGRLTLPMPVSRPPAPVRQVCLDWTTGAGWEPRPECPHFHLRPGRE